MAYPQRRRVDAERQAEEERIRGEAQRRAEELRRAEDERHQADERTRGDEARSQQQFSPSGTAAEAHRVQRSAAQPTPAANDA